MQEEIIDLQSKLAFQEQTINQLNDVLTSQQRQIDRLQLQLSILQDRFEEIQEAPSALAQDEKPPHY